jgi:hypothetical protein
MEQAYKAVQAGKNFRFYTEISVRLLEGETINIVGKSADKSIKYLKEVFHLDAECTDKSEDGLTYSLALKKSS